MWLLQAWQCLFLVILVFAVLGFMRGWRREILSVAFILAGVLVIGVGGGQAVAQMIFVRLPLAFQDPNNLQKPPAPNATEIAVVTVLTLIAIIVIGYLIGNKVFPKPSTAAERVWGVIPGLIAGLAIYFTISQMAPVLTKGPAIGLLVSAPNQNVISNSLLLIFVVLVVLVIIGLITSNTRKSGGGSGGGKK
ncbi:MAG: CvpA family protein [Ktedonobacteraceae bacterium]